MEKKYDLYGKFDIELHKENFPKYLETLIMPDGTVEYAVPSHIYKAEKVAAKKLGISIQEVRSICPQDYWFDYLHWLLKISGAIATWYNGCTYATITKKQIATLRRLKMAGVYAGDIPAAEETTNGNDKISEIY